MSVCILKHCLVECYYICWELTSQMQNRLTERSSQTYICWAAVCKAIRWKDELCHRQASGHWCSWTVPCWEETSLQDESLMIRRFVFTCTINTLDTQCCLCSITEVLKGSRTGKPFALCWCCSRLREPADWCCLQGLCWSGPQNGRKCRFSLC